MPLVQRLLVVLVRMLPELDEEEEEEWDDDWDEDEEEDDDEGDGGGGGDGFHFRDEGAGAVMNLSDSLDMVGGAFGFDDDDEDDDDDDERMEEETLEAQADALNEIDLPSFLLQFFKWAATDDFLAPHLNAMSASDKAILQERIEDS
jgi:hypothetical protein